MLTVVSAPNFETAATILVAVEISKKPRGEAGAHTEDLCHLAGVVSVDTTGEGGEGVAHVEINAGTTSERECPQRK